MASTTTSSASRDTHGELLEREEELRALAQAAAAAAAGRGSVISIEGPAGVGKTRLLGAAGEVAADLGLEPLTARGGKLERDYGFGVARQLFERRLVSLAAADRERVLAGAAGLAAALLGLAAPRGEPSPAAAPDPEFAAVHGLYWLAVNLAADSPLLISVDDAQWADGASLRFLAYLARRIAELPALLVVISRAGEPESPEELLATIAADGSRMRPRPLSAYATRELVRSSLGRPGDPAFVAACHDASGGNPFLLSALLATVRSRAIEPTATAVGVIHEAGTGAISDAVAERLRSLPGSASVLADAIAVLGNAAELHHAAALANLDEDAAAAAADALTAADILAPARPLEFVHPLVGAAVYEGMPGGRRALAHARAAALLESVGAEPEQVALHLLQAEPGAVQDSPAKLQRAAARALERGSPESAGRYLRHALRDPVPGAQRGELLHQLGAIELRRGEPAAIEHLRQALELAPAGAGRATVARELSLSLVPSGNYGAAIDVLEQASSQLGEEDRELSLWIEAEIGTEAMLCAGALPRAVERLLPRLAEVERAATPAERAVLATIAIIEAAGEADAAQVAGHAARVLRRGLLDDCGPDAHVIYNLPFPLVLADRYDDAVTALDEILAESRRRGSLLGVARAGAFRSNLALRQGALAEAEEHAHASIEAAAPMWIVRQMSTGWLIESLVERGELDQARAQLELAQLDGELDDVLMHNFPLLSRARLRLALGATEDALEDLQELDRREGGGRARNPAWFGHRALMAEALIRLGETERARALADEEHVLARRWGAPRALGIALRAAGLTRSGEERIGLLEEASGVLEPSGAALEHARALVDLGAALRREGRRRDCREPLTAGMEIAHRRGARPLAERAREELVASGARPRRMIRSGIDALTPSELRVVRLASEGMTNREIAQGLFVTMRTVEAHLTHAYQKLDISSRDELPHALAV